MEEHATQLIGDLEIDPRLVQERLGPKVRGKPSRGSYQGANIVTFGDLGLGYICLVDDGEIIYFVRHKTVRHNGFRLGRQVLLWRHPVHSIAAGFAYKVFFDWLLPKYGALIADQEQTSHGKRFWQLALSRAFQQNLNVYFLDRRSSPTRLIKLEDMQEVKKYDAALWGHSEGHKRTFAVISTKPLSLKKRT